MSFVGLAVADHVRAARALMVDAPRQEPRLDHVKAAPISGFGCGVRLGPVEAAQDQPRVAPVGPPEPNGEAHRGLLLLRRLDADVQPVSARVGQFEPL